MADNFRSITVQELLGRYSDALFRTRIFEDVQACIYGACTAVMEGAKSRDHLAVKECLDLLIYIYESLDEHFERTRGRLNLQRLVSIKIIREFLGDGKSANLLSLNDSEKLDTTRLYVNRKIIQFFSSPATVEAIDSRDLDVLEKYVEKTWKDAGLMADWYLESEKIQTLYRATIVAGTPELLAEKDLFEAIPCLYTYLIRADCLATHSTPLISVLDPQTFSLIEEACVRVCYEYYHREDISYVKVANTLQYLISRYRQKQAG